MSVHSECTSEMSAATSESHWRKGKGCEEHGRDVKAVPVKNGRAKGPSLGSKNRMQLSGGGDSGRGFSEVARYRGRRRIWTARMQERSVPGNSRTISDWKQRRI